MRRKDKLSFVDIRDPSYAANEHGGIEFEDAMKHIHVITGNVVHLRISHTMRHLACCLARGVNLAASQPPARCPCTAMCEGLLPRTDQGLCNMLNCPFMHAVACFFAGVPTSGR